jgi:very-short-patch-repair endonuclease
MLSNSGRFKKGDTPWWVKRGLPHPSFGLFKKGHPQLNTGRTHFKKGNNPYYNSENKPTKDVIRKCLTRRPMSDLEIKMNDILIKNNLPYKFVGNGKFFIENKNPDFVNINGKKIAVEVYYKKHKERFRGNVDDWKKERSKLFAKYGWKLLFFDELQVNNDFVIKNLI